MMMSAASKFVEHCSRCFLERSTIKSADKVLVQPGPNFPERDRRH